MLSSRQSHLTLIDGSGVERPIACVYGAGSGRHLHNMTIHTISSNAFDSASSCSVIAIFFQSFSLPSGQRWKSRLSANS